jgi:hypothetical protein
LLLQLPISIQAHYYLGGYAGAIGGRFVELMSARTSVSAPRCHPTARDEEHIGSLYDQRAPQTARPSRCSSPHTRHVKFGTSRKDYHAQFTNALEKAADRIKPELVLVSAGFDAHAKDPIGSLGLEVEDFAKLTKQVLDVAKTHAKGRLVSCLEGGYNVEMLAESVEVHLKELLAD